MLLLSNQKILVAYYTRTNNTQKVAENIATKLNAELDRIFDINDYSGIIGFIRAGYEAISGNKTTITTTKDPSEYDLVIVCSPVWSGTVPPAIRSYFDKFNVPQSAFLFTCGSSKNNIKNLPLTTNSVRTIYKIETLDIKNNDFTNQIKEFIGML